MAVILKVRLSIRYSISHVVAGFHIWYWEEMGIKHSIYCMKDFVVVTIMKLLGSLCQCFDEDLGNKLVDLGIGLHECALEIQVFRCGCVTTKIYSRQLSHPQATLDSQEFICVDMFVGVFTSFTT